MPIWFHSDYRAYSWYFKYTWYRKVISNPCDCVHIQWCLCILETIRPITVMIKTTCMTIEITMKIMDDYGIAGHSYLEYFGHAVYVKIQCIAAEFSNNITSRKWHPFGKCFITQSICIIVSSRKSIKNIYVYTWEKQNVVFFINWTATW